MLTRDKPGCLQLRLDIRPQHVDWLNGIDGEGRLRFAGAFLGEDGKPDGSMVAVEVDNAAAAARAR